MGKSVREKRKEERAKIPGERVNRDVARANAFDRVDAHAHREPAAARER
jgi:hypothetical protein